MQSVLCMWVPSALKDSHAAIVLRTKGHKEEVVFSAKKLPQSHLGNHLESHVKALLDKSGCGDSKVNVRVVSCADKFFQVVP